MRQHNLRVTGSLTLNGENVVSASQLSALTQTLTGQYATTSSNSYNGNQTITGSVIVTGTITANEFHTTFVTSSVLYTSGSSKFGDTNDDIMEVTGSLKVDGNITANNLSGIVSGSSQITSLLPTGVVSGSSQLTASYDVRYVISGSITQTTWDNIASKPSGIVSASSQVILQSTTGQLSASRVDGLNLTQISSGSYTASIGQTFNVNTNTIITGSLSVSSLSGSGINYLAYSGGIVTAISGTAAIKYNQEFTATLGQTIFTPSVGYVSGLIDVYYNGTKLSAADYTATNGYNISLVQGADLAGDIIEIAIYNPVSGVSNNVLRQQTTFTASVAQTTFTINYTPGLIDVFFNGSRLANEEYTANNGTSIILSEATTGGEILDVFVYSYQVGAFSGVGGSGVLNQLAYWSSQSGLTGSNSLTFDGTTLTISGSLVPAVSGAYDLGSTTKPFRHIYVGSGSIYLVDNSGQVTNTISAQSIVTTDTLNSGTIDLTKSLPTGTVSGSSQIVGILTSLNTATASFTPRITNLESKSASVDITISSINSKTGSYATTGSNTFYGTQTYSGSVYIANDLVVQGSSSIQYISASSVSIGTNIVQLNTANPSVRFAGLTIIDSGSIGGSGSFLYDSVHDEFIFVHRGNGTNVTSSHFVLGPETYDNLGNELYLTCNIISKGTGKEHLVDSCIFDNGTTTCIKNNLIGTGTACFGSCVTATQFNISTSGGATQIYNTGGGHTVITNATANKDMNIQTFGTGGQYFNTAGADRFIIASTGAATFACSVNIGTTGSEKLNIFGSGSQFINVKNTTSAADMFVGMSSALAAAFIGTGGTDPIVFSTAGTEKMRITSGGNVLIGTTCIYNTANFIVSAGSGASSSPYMGIFNCTTSPTADASTRLDLGFLGGASNYVATGGCLGAINFMGQGNDAGYGGASIIIVTTCGGNTCRFNHAIDMVFTTKPTGNTGAPERMRINNAGNVGIGITDDNPIGNGGTYRNLLVGNGAGYGVFQGITTATATDSTIVAFSGGTTGASANKNGGSINLELDGTSTSRAIGRWVFYTNSATSFAERMRITSGGCVGIGCTVPYHRLHIKGTEHYQLGVYDSAASIKLGADDDTMIGMNMRNDTSGIDWFIGNHDPGSSGIQDRITFARLATGGAWTFPAKLSSAGALTILGALTQNASDIRLKTNICNIPNAIDKITSLNGFTYNWNELASNLGPYCTNIKQIGVSAQDVQSILPEAVFLAGFDVDSDDDNKSKSGENYLTIQYEKLVPLLIEGIKEQQCTIQCLTNRIEQLENK